MDFLIDTLKEVRALKLENKNNNNLEDAYNLGIDLACKIIEKQIAFRDSVTGTGEPR